MVLIERISYEIGGILADVILVSTLPTGGFTVYKLATRLSKFATDHSTYGFTPDQLTENIFECLPFIE